MKGELIEEKVTLQEHCSQEVVNQNCKSSTIILNYFLTDQLELISCRCIRGVEVNGESLTFKVTIASLWLSSLYLSPIPPHITIGEAELPSSSFLSLYYMGDTLFKKLFFFQSYFSLNLEVIQFLKAVHLICVDLNAKKNPTFKANKIIILRARQKSKNDSYICGAKSHHKKKHFSVCPVLDFKSKVILCLQLFKHINLLFYKLSKRFKNEMFRPLFVWL